jgi:hypothetical protein
MRVAGEWNWRLPRPIEKILLVRHPPRPATEAAD